MQSTMKKKLFPLAIILLLAIGLVPQPTKAEEGSGITIYVVPAITDEKILPTTSISSDYISNQISIVASPGEYEPASFVIRAHEDIASLQVQATDLTGTNGSIPASNVDIRVVKCWIQRDQPFGGPFGSASWQTKSLTPELLLKDDSLVKVEGGENYLKLTNGTYVWISNTNESYSSDYRKIISIADLPVQDADTLQPVNISSETNKQFWVTVNVSNEALAGIYTGKIESRTPAGLIGEVQLQLEVLPIKLSAPYLTYSLYYRGTYSITHTDGSISSEWKSEEQLSAELKDMRDHGVLSPTIMYAPGDVDSNPKWSGLIKQLSIRQQLGMDTQSVYYLGWLGPDTAAFINMVKSLGVSDVYVYSVDEPTPDSLSTVRAQCEAIHALGGKVFTALSSGSLLSAEMASLADVLDLAVICDSSYYDYAYSRDIANITQLANQYNNYGNRIFSYGDPQAGVYEAPETYRRNYGLLLWQKGFDGAMDYAYQDGYCNIWNDVDQGLCKDHVFAYPTQNGVIDTIQWEGWREGVDDVRYLTTLLKAIEEAKAKGKDTSLAESWLAGLKNENLETKDLGTVRLQMATYILGLTGSDTTSPVIASVVTSKVTGASATINWITNELASSEVEYGTTTDLGLSEGNFLVMTNHRVTLTDLTPSATYYYRVKSKDIAGNLATSVIYSFTNPPSHLLVSFVSPTTDADNAVIDRNWTEVSVSIDGTYHSSTFIDWNHSLVGYWGFNENSGSKADDSSTYNNVGSVFGATWTTGKLASALQLDGTDDYVDCGNATSFSITDAITLEAWIKITPSSDPNYETILDKANSFAKNWAVRASDGFVVWYVAGVGDWNIGLYPELIDGSWHHVAVSYDKDGGSNNMRFYIDGLLKAGTTMTGSIATSTSNLRIGHSGFWSGYFGGTIDEVRIWSRALSPEEIRASCNANNAQIYSFSNEFTNLADGSYQYCAYVTDSTGSSAKTETRTISVNTTVIPGDANGDGRINTADLTVLERIIAGLQSPASGADVNQDGRINTADITAIERMITGTG